jgi:NO-binding membrane sensor protein with MHYT domain
MPSKLSEYAKAAAAFLLAAYTGYQAARLASSPAGEGVTVDEWIGLAVTAVTLGFGVWAVPNAAKSPPTS